MNVTLYFLDVQSYKACRSIFFTRIWGNDSVLGVYFIGLPFTAIFNTVKFSSFILPQLIIYFTELKRYPT